jgi:hypothetical protein
MAFMIDHCVYSQVVWIWKTGLTQPALKRFASNVEHLVNPLPSLPLQLLLYAFPFLLVICEDFLGCFLSQSTINSHR